MSPISSIQKGHLADNIPAPGSPGLPGRPGWPGSPRIIIIHLKHMP